jgi:hypothetical protein
VRSLCSPSLGNSYFIGVHLDLRHITLEEFGALEVVHFSLESGLVPGNQSILVKGLCGSGVTPLVCGGFFETLPSCEHDCQSRRSQHINRCPSLRELGHRCLTLRSVKLRGSLHQHSARHSLHSLHRSDRYQGQ